MQGKKVTLEWKPKFYMEENELQKRCAEASERGRQYLISCVENDCFFDKWYGTSIPPPVEHSASPMLCFFTALALRDSGGIPDTVSSSLQEKLALARKGHSYGYDQFAPVDSDDTAFALRTLIALGETVTAEMLREAFKPFRCGDSWFTFAANSIAGHTPPFQPVYQGPQSVRGPHPEVHLNILALHQEIGIKEIRIPALPEMNGLPVSYFYKSELYGAWLFGQICKGIALDYPPLRIAAMGIRNSNGGWSGFTDGFSAVQETALGLLTLKTFDGTESGFEPSLVYLLGQQLENGSFPGGTLWHHRLPQDNGKFIWYATDEMSIVSTGLAILALNSFILAGQI